MSAPAKRWVVVGGGMLGLTLAHLLRRRGNEVTVIESAPCLGGLAGVWRLGDVVWDRHYHVILLSDLHLRSLLRQLGLEHEIRWVFTRTGCYSDGKLYSVSNSLELLRFPVLRLSDKLRLAATVLYASRIRNGRRLEQIPVEDWLVRWSGKRVFERFWLPLLRSKLGDSYRSTSAAFIWAIIARLYAARRSGLKEEMFGYVPGGYARILERFQSLLTEDGVELHVGRPVERVEGGEGGVGVSFRDGERETYDRAVVTVNAPLAARLCPSLLPRERELLEGIRYQGIVCASVLLRRPLASYYVTNILDRTVPFTGVIEMTTLVEPAELGGRSLVYLPRYLDADDPFFRRPDDEVEKLFLDALDRMYPDFRREDVVSFRISRVRRVLPLATLDYSSRLPPVETSIPGLFLVNSAHIVNGTLNVNETVQLAERAAQTLAAAA